MRTMVIISVLWGIVITLSGHSFCAEQPERMAIVTDTARASSEVKGLYFDCSQIETEFSTGLSGWIVLRSKTSIDVAIRVDDVVSIDRKDGSFEVKYWTGGKEISLAGTIPGKLCGSTDLGRYELETDKLKQVAFKEAPAERKEGKKLPYDLDSAIILKDGSKVPVAALGRRYSYFRTTGYLVGGQTVYEADETFPFLLGKSRRSADFAEVKKVELGADGACTVTLRNGKNTTGRIQRGGGKDGIEGFTGVSEPGYFFIEPEKVKAIEFGIRTQ